MGEQIEASPRALFDIVDEGALKDLLATPAGAGAGAGARNIWHIYPLSVLLSGRWREHQPDLPEVRIPLTARA